MIVFSGYFVEFYNPGYGFTHSILIESIKCRRDVEKWCLYFAPKKWVTVGMIQQFRDYFWRQLKLPARTPIYCAEKE